MGITLSTAGVVSTRPARSAVRLRRFSNKVHPQSVRQWVLSLPIPLRLLLAAHPELVIPVLQVVQRVVTGHMLDGVGLKVEEGQGVAVTLIQRFGSAAILNIHLHCLVLEGVYRCGVDGVPVFCLSK